MSGHKTSTINFIAIGVFYYRSKKKESNLI
jgi:hypothetical protein